MDKRKSFLKNSGFVEKIGLMVALFVIVVVFTVINKNYFSTQNLLNILTSASLTGLVAIGETYLIIAGLIDLSPGSIAAFSSVVAGLLLTMGVPSMLILPLVVLIGLLIGFLNGMGVNKLKLEPFIVTLSAMSIFRGLGYILCGGKPVFISDKSFTDIGSRQVLGIFNLPVLVLILAFLVSAIVLSKTFFGRSVYVLGGNKYAARLAGLNPEKISTILFMISAGLSALGGGLLAARMQSSQPSSCSGLEFDALTASVLGGDVRRRGVGRRDDPRRADPPVLQHRAHHGAGPGLLADRGARPAPADRACLRLLPPKQAPEEDADAEHRGRAFRRKLSRQRGSAAWSLSV